MKKIITIMILLALLPVLVQGLNSKDYKENMYILETEYNFSEQAQKDLMVFTDKFEFSGTVNKDLWIIAQEVNMLGVVGDDLRILSSKATINTIIFNDLKFIGDKIIINEDTIISNNLDVNAKYAEIKGSVHGNAKIKANKVYISGLIRQDIEIVAEQLEISPEATILGHVTLSPGLTVDETIVKSYSYSDEILVKSIKDMLIGKVAIYLMILLLGGFLILTSKNKIKKLSETTQKGFLLSFLIGLLILLVTPFLIMLLLITIIGIPLALLMLFLYLSIIIISPVFLSIIIGRTTLGLFNKKTLLGLELILGSAILLMIMLIPNSTGTIIIFSSSITLGALALSMYGWKKNKKVVKTENIKKSKKAIRKK